MSRRYAEATQAFLWLLRRRLRPVPPGEGLPLVLDRTGLSLVGAGAWAAAIPGGRGQRGWRPRHRGGDRSGVILVPPLPVRCPPCGRRRAPRSPTSGPITGERDRFRPLAPPVAVWAAFWGRCAAVAAAAGVARRGPTVGLAVRGSRPPGLRAAVCPAPSRSRGAYCGPATGGRCRVVWRVPVFGRVGPPRRHVCRDRGPARPCGLGATRGAQPGGVRPPPGSPYAVVRRTLGQASCFSQCGSCAAGSGSPVSEA